MKALITGISGFTGRHLAKLLEQEGLKVSGIDVRPKTRDIQADLKDKDKVEEIILKQKPDWIFHLASPILRTDQLIDESLAKNLEVDLFGTVNLLQAAAKLKKKPKMLITGTAAVYQQKEGRAFKETDKLEARTAYGLSKLTQELVGLKLAKSYGVSLVVSRSILLIGAGQAEGFVINDLIKQVAEMELGKRKPVLYVGNLETKRDFTDIRDGVKGYLTLMRKGKAGEIYNVCSGQATAIKEVIEWLKANSRVEFKVKEKKQWRKNDLKVLTADNQKIKKLGWQPEYSLEESLGAVLDYWRN